MEYTRDLGYCAAKYLLAGGNAAMISMQGGHFVPIPFASMLDPATGRTRVRMVDIHSTRYAIARRYMIRLRRDDFEDPARARAASPPPRASRWRSSGTSSSISSRRAAAAGPRGPVASAPRRGAERLRPPRVTLDPSLMTFAYVA